MIATLLQPYRLTKSDRALLCMSSGALICMNNPVYQVYLHTRITKYMCHALKMMRARQQPHGVIPSVAPNMMHMGTNRKAQ